MAELSLEPMTVATKPVLFHSILSSLLAIFINIEESNRPPPAIGREARGTCHVKGLEKVQAIKREIPGRCAQGQPEARATKQNCLVYTAIPLRKASATWLEATATGAQRQKLLTCDNDHSLELYSEPMFCFTFTTFEQVVACGFGG